MQSHYELFCVMLGRLEVVKLVISAKLASDFISLHCNCLTFDGPHTTTPAQRKLPLPLFQSCQFHLGSLWLCDLALHTTMSICLPKYSKQSGCNKERGDAMSLGKCLY